MPDILKVLSYLGGRERAGVARPVHQVPQGRPPRQDGDGDKGT